MEAGLLGDSAKHGQLQGPCLHAHIKCVQMTRSPEGGEKEMLLDLSSYPRYTTNAERYFSCLLKVTTAIISEHISALSTENSIKVREPLRPKAWCLERSHLLAAPGEGNQWVGIKF